MRPSPGRQYDFGWSRSNLSALIVVSLLAAAVLAGRAAERRIWLGECVPVQLHRVRAAKEKIDPNTAPVASLRCLGGIGPAKARAIVEYRNAHGPRAFRCAGDLQNVPGIGPGIVERIAPHLNLPARRD